MLGRLCNRATVIRHPSSVIGRPRWVAPTRYFLSDVLSGMRLLIVQR
jgi:hypothetical protein